jgi:hypothetical protein
MPSRPGSRCPPPRRAGLRPPRFWTVSKRSARRKPRDQRLTVFQPHARDRPTPASSPRWPRSRRIRNGSGSQFKSTPVRAATITDFRRNRDNRSPTRRVLRLVIQHHPHGSLTHFRRKPVRCLACHRSTMSGVGASAKPGAVHRSVYQ